MRARRHDPRRAQRGLAMVAVLLVLMALFVLCAPFLVTVRNADQASAEGADRALLRVTLDAAQRHAAALLSSSHPAVDVTPYFDDQQELAVSSRFAEDFLVTRDPRQVMWDLDAEDVAGRIDLASASPHVLANLIGGAARLTAECKEQDTKLELSNTSGFLPQGVVLVDDEVIGYTQLGPTQLGGLARGLLTKPGPDGGPASCGPPPPLAHAVGAFVLDQRAWALCEWRIATGELRAYEGIEQVREAADFALAPELGREAFLALERGASPFGHVKAGARWQHAARMVGDVTGEPQFGCRLPVDELRWFNPGTTVWISDGRNSELALVRGTAGGALVLSEPLRQPFKAGATVVAPLARTPVNVNTASPEVLAALWTNLKLAGKSARITEGEAQQLVDLALVSRPFTGFEDFLRRLVLPAAGLDELPADAPVRPAALEELARESKPGADGQKTLLGFIDPDDARALYKCALNANDNELEFATMPLCFTAREVYQLDLRAAVNAPSGIERARGVRAVTEMIVPQRDLLSVWTRQEDFDDAPRLERAAAGWMTGPVPTARHDPFYGEVASLRWPTRARAHLGPYDSAPSLDPLLDATRVYSFAGRENDAGWAQLAPSREEEAGRRATWALHFDDESKTLEGRFLPDGPAPLDLAKLGWSGAGSLMSGMGFSMWVQPRELEEGARLLDVGGPYSDADRLTLLFEQGDLVLRVLDGAGDHPATSFKEQAEVRFPLGEGAGLPLETWSHVQIAVDGSRPDQLALWVDGRRVADTPGLTRLTGALSGESDRLEVESTDGFPDKCVVRIGSELIEVTKRGPTSFTAQYEALGENGGFGGRLAREMFQGVEGQEINQGLFKDTDHPAGSSVQLYGYSLPFFSNVPSAGSPLTASLGPFAVARAVGIVKSGEQTERKMEPIQGLLVSGNTLQLGWGLDSQDKDVEGLILEAADPGRSSSDVMRAFSPNGGYAALLSLRWQLSVTEFGGATTTVTTDRFGVRLGGVEVVRYSGYQGNKLLLTARGDEVNLPTLAAGANPDVSGRGSFIFYFDEPFTDLTWSAQNNQLSSQVMVIPISIPAGGSGGITGFPPGVPGRSEFAQLTRLGAEAHLTEWVRYDDVTSDGHLVRDDPRALLAANEAAHAGIGSIDFEGDRNPPGSGGGPGSPGGSADGPVRLLTPAPPAAARTFVRPTGAQGGESIWNYHMGEREDRDFLVTRAVGSHLQFRGVLGTYSHAQPGGTMVLPTFRLFDRDETLGQPGRFDAVTLFLDDPAEPGFPAVVQRAHRPFQYTHYFWTDPESGAFAAEEGQAPVAVGEAGMVMGVTYCALQEPLKIFIPASPVGDPENPVDGRTLARMTLFPSGELPRRVENGQLGGDARSGAGVPAAVVDEALFFPSHFATFAGMPSQLVLARRMDESESTLQALEDVVRTTLGDNSTKVDVLATLPEHGGLLRIGDEILCYDSYDKDSFVFTLPSGARGLCGTEVQPHRAGEGITYLGALPVGILGANIGADDALIPLLEAPAGFPSQGTLRIEDELVHYTRSDGAVLEMPRASAEPGAMDRKGPGLFRGRFGTERASHAAGTPVVLFPFRYWDRWSELADAPEMTYFQLACDQPDAYWKRVFWKTGESGFAGPQLGVLQRSAAATPWDAAPAATNGLTLLMQGKLEADGNPIGVQSDRVEWRIFVRHGPGSFDPRQGLSHGWKTSPRLELFGVEYMGPSRTLTRVDR